VHGIATLILDGAIKAAQNSLDGEALTARLLGGAQ
jgi:hypothetical protein